MARSEGARSGRTISSRLSATQAFAMVLLLLRCVVVPVPSSLARRGTKRGKSDCWDRGPSIEFGSVVHLRPTVKDCSLGRLRKRAVRLEYRDSRFRARDGALAADGEEDRPHAARRGPVATDLEHVRRTCAGTCACACTRAYSLSCQPLSPCHLATLPPYLRRLAPLAPPSRLFATVRRNGSCARVWLRAVSRAPSRVRTGDASASLTNGEQHRYRARSG